MLMPWLLMFLICAVPIAATIANTSRPQTKRAVILVRSRSDGAQ